MRSNICARARFSIPVGAGKASCELLRILSIPVVGPDVEEYSGKDPRRFLIELTQRELEDHDFRRITGLFASATPPEQLRRICGRNVFTVGGYDRDNREVFEIDVVRRFYKALHLAYPMWVFAGALDGPALLAAVLSIAPEMQMIRRAGESTIEAHVPMQWLRQFFCESIKTTTLLHYRAGISPVEGAYQINRAAEYFKIL
jgi:hypothetical protein